MKCSLPWFVVGFSTLAPQLEIARIRCDLEGAFRGQLLEHYCKGRDIEPSFVPAEHHESTGDVECSIGELKKKVWLAHLCNYGDDELEDAAYEMCSAHNRVSRTNGYSPAQWAFGQDPREPDGLATWSAAVILPHNAKEHPKTIGCRSYRKLQAHAKISCDGLVQDVY